MGLADHGFLLGAVWKKTLSTNVHCGRATTRTPAQTSAQARDGQDMAGTTTVDVFELNGTSITVAEVCSGIASGSLTWEDHLHHTCAPLRQHLSPRDVCAQLYGPRPHPLQGFQCGCSRQYRWPIRFGQDQNVEPAYSASRRQERSLYQRH